MLYVRLHEVIEEKVVSNLSETAVLKLERAVTCAYIICAQNMYDVLMTGF